MIIKAESDISLQKKTEQDEKKAAEQYEEDEEDSGELLEWRFK
jgi:hypothetical protein